MFDIFEQQFGSGETMHVQANLSLDCLPVLYLVPKSHVMANLYLADFGR